MSITPLATGAADAAPPIIVTLRAGLSRLALRAVLTVAAIAAELVTLAFWRVVRTQAREAEMVAAIGTPGARADMVARVAPIVRDGHLAARAWLRRLDDVLPRRLVVACPLGGGGRTAHVGVLGKPAQPAQPVRAELARHHWPGHLSQGAAAGDVAAVDALVDGDGRLEGHAHHVVVVRLRVLDVLHHEPNQRRQAGVGHHARTLVRVLRTAEWELLGDIAQGALDVLHDARLAKRVPAAAHAEELGNGHVVEAHGTGMRALHRHDRRRRAARDARAAVRLAIGGATLEAQQHVGTRDVERTGGALVAHGAQLHAEVDNGRRRLGSGLTSADATGIARKRGDKGVQRGATYNMVDTACIGKGKKRDIPPQKA
jgi:hypothetical protein